MTIERLAVLINARCAAGQYTRVGQQIKATLGYWNDPATFCLLCAEAQGIVRQIVGRMMEKDGYISQKREVRTE